MPKPPDLGRLALAMIAAEEAELALRLRLLRCDRDRDHVLLGALELAHGRAVENRERVGSQLRAAWRVMAEGHAPPGAVAA